MRRSHLQIRPRRRVFLGCEGESERGFGGALQWFLDESGPHVYLDLVTLEPGGDPLALVDRAKCRIEERQRKHGSYERRAVLLDADRLGQKPDRDAQIQGLARSAKMTLIWQHPCHEALLLRHLIGCGQLRPQSCADAFTALRRRWPDYKKGLSAVELAERIGEQQIRQAMAVEPEFGNFLRSLGVR